MNFPFYIAKRYAFSKSRSNAINVITAIAAVAIVVSAMAMIIVMSVFSGLREFSTSFTNELDPELKAFSIKGKSFVLTPEQELRLKASPSLAGVSKVVEDRVLFLFNEKQVVANIKGVDAAFLQVTNMESNLLFGQWLEADSEEVVLGLGVAHKLSMGLFDTENAFKAYAIKPGTGAIDNPESAFNERHLIPMGIYTLKNDDLDEKYVFASLHLAQELLGLAPNEVSNLEFKLAPQVNLNKAIADIQSILGEQVQIKNRMQLNDSLYKMLNTENIVVYLIFTLVVIITLFNLAGALIMIILEKQNNMKTLHNLGVRERSLRRVFLLQGLILTSFGGFIGISLGIVVVLVQQRYELLKITSEMGYPVKITIDNILLVGSTIFVLGFLASYVAASRVNKKYLRGE
ncbi:ABC transporter permease [Flavobacterium sp. JP2137]|uniref:ABC transporter permease n=1 Tax=Flavobacterium sp. JP2137 TaxID=3414510 RepID=UPI003D2FB0E1